MQEEPLVFRDASGSCFKCLCLITDLNLITTCFTVQAKVAALQKEEVQLNDIMLQKIIAKSESLRWLEQE